MAEACVLLLFAAAIVVCATTGVSVVFALCFGFFVFTGYGLFKGFTLRALFPILAFVLFGVLIMLLQGGRF